MGVWEVDIKYFKKPNSKKYTCIGFMMSDEDLERNFGMATSAFEGALLTIKVKNNKKERKNDK